MEIAPYAAGSVRRFLLVQLKRLGDLILTAPAVAALRAAAPEAEIVMLTTKAAADLARCIKGVDRVITYRRGGANLEAWSSAIMGPWEACFDFTGTDRSALLTSLTKAKHRVGYAKFAENRLRRRAYTQLCEAKVRDLHTVDFHLALVAERFREECAGFTVEGSECFVIPPVVQQGMAKELEARGIGATYAVVHPGTAREEKAWHVSRWAEVITHLQQEFALPVVLTGSGDGWEHEHLQAIQRHLEMPVVDLSNQLSLAELAALVEGCTFMLGVDSMAMHLAAMFNRPQVALFGPTNPFHWRPRHDRGLVLTSSSSQPMRAYDPRMAKGDVKLISTDSVLRAIRNLFPHT